MDNQGFYFDEESITDDASFEEIERRENQKFLNQFEGGAIQG